jgi:hypothetical protein
MTVPEYIASAMRNIGFKTQHPEIPALTCRQFDTDFPLVFLDFPHRHGAFLAKRKSSLGARAKKE